MVHGEQSYFKFTFFDPNEPSCQLMLSDPRTQAGHLFAILRQWVPQVQQSVDIIGQEILQRGCNVDDRDGLTDMTLLHFTCKAGAPGVGDQARATRFAAHLLELGADVNARSRWTNMNALHYAAYFDVPEIIQLIIKTAGLTGMLHVYGLDARKPNLCLDAFSRLLPWDVVPNPADLPLEMSDMAMVAREMRALLAAAMPKAISVADHSGIPEAEASRGDEEVKTELTPGQRITISGRKVIGVLRFVGSTQFSSGQWAGIELDQPIGKHDGSVHSVRYFRCPPNHGEYLLRTVKAPSPLHISHQWNRLPVLFLCNRRCSVIKDWFSASVSSATPEDPKLELGERIVVAGHRVGVIRFHGNTEFAPGFWYGVELDEPLGKNDGSVSGVRYFHCPSKHGLFAPPSRVHR
uniref:CAP-Gly domain containing linker protein family member 4 n=1 Tax=Eptatretus burgeri TaxID=7764 RepID=A0A8C4QTD0_EPTBU